MHHDPTRECVCVDETEQAGYQTMTITSVPRNPLRSFACMLVCCLSLLRAATLAALEVPAYSSLPGASHSLYLNFGGVNMSWWAGYEPGDVPAYDIDNNPTAFSPTELANVQQIWGDAQGVFLSTVLIGSGASEPVFKCLAIASSNAKDSSITRCLSWGCPILTCLEEAGGHSGGNSWNQPGERE
jgi:hypothetical protein